MFFHKLLNFLTTSFKMYWYYILKGKFKVKNSKISKIISIILTVTIVAGAVFGIIYFSKRNSPYEESFIAMGTVFSVKIYGGEKENAAKQIKDTVENSETQLLSRLSENSSIAKINKNGSGEISEELFNLITLSQQVSADSDGSYDMTVGALTGLWNIGTENARVPSDEELSAALETVGYEKVTLTSNSITLSEGQQIDLGAIGKGYMCDKAVEILKENNVESAVISAGGSILVYGENPSGGEWKVGIRDPFGTSSDIFSALSVNESYISTSGDYERTFTENGKTYHHILNPQTGYPADSGLSSVTVISGSGALSDALSTACFVLGYEKSLPLLEKYGAEGIFVTHDKKVYTTDGIKDSIQITEEDFTLN